MLGTLGVSDGLRFEDVDGDTLVLVSADRLGLPADAPRALVVAHDTNAPYVARLMARVSGTGPRAAAARIIRVIWPTPDQLRRQSPFAARSPIHLAATYAYRTIRLPVPAVRYLTYTLTKRRSRFRGDHASR